MKFKITLSTAVLGILLIGYLGSLIPTGSKQEGFRSHAQR